MILSQLEIETSKGLNSVFNHLLTVLWKTVFGKTSVVLLGVFCFNESNYDYNKLNIVIFCMFLLQLPVKYLNRSGFHSRKQKNVCFPLPLPLLPKSGWLMWITGPNKSHLLREIILKTGNEKMAEIQQKIHQYTVDKTKVQFYCY